MFNKYSFQSKKRSVKTLQCIGGLLNLIHSGHWPLGFRTRAHSTKDRSRFGQTGCNHPSHLSSKTVSLAQSVKCLGPANNPFEVRPTKYVWVAVAANNCSYWGETAKINTWHWWLWSANLHFCTKPCRSEFELFPDLKISRLQLSTTFFMLLLLKLYVYTYFSLLWIFHVIYWSQWSIQVRKH